MSYKNVRSFKCHYDSRGFISKVDYTDWRGATTSSAPDAPDGVNHKEHFLNVGERLTKVENSIIRAEFEI